MKTLWLTVLCVFALLASARPSDARLERQMHRLIDGLPSALELAEYARFLQPTPIITPTPADLREARRKMKLAQQRLPKIFALLKPGASVFDYPGLLALGSVGYDGAQPSGGYWLHVGGYPLAYNESRPAEFMVRFDAKGRITEIDDLVCRQ